jgi:hypothetical protein
VPRVPELLFPLVAKGIVRDEQLLTFWHESLLFVFPPGARITITYKPRTGFIYLAWAMTLGKTRDYATGDVLTTDDFYFFHRHSQMRWHYDPLLESIYEFEYPHWLEITEDDPAEIEFVNNTGLTVIQDITIWMFECAEEHWPIVQQYLKGLFKTLYERGAESK